MTREVIKEIENMKMKISDKKIALAEAEYDLQRFISSKLPLYKNLVFNLFWDCPTSPIGGCVYDMDSNMRDDECIYCGEPLERK